MSRANKKKKKLANLAYMDSSGIKYDVNPKCPWHYHAYSGNDRYDFWPTTGKYLDLATGKYGIGISDMIVMIQKKRKFRIKELAAKLSFKRLLSKASTDAQHRQRKIMQHFGMDFSANP